MDVWRLNNTITVVNTPSSSQHPFSSSKSWPNKRTPYALPIALFPANTNI
jgi:hypothetical protein